MDFGGFIMQILTSYLSKAEFRSLKPQLLKERREKKKGLSQEITIRSPTTRSQAGHLQPFLASAPASVPLFQMMNQMMGPSTTSC